MHDLDMRRSCQLTCVGMRTLKVLVVKVEPRRDGEKALNGKP